MKLSAVACAGALLLLTACGPRMSPDQVAVAETTAPPDDQVPGTATEQATAPAPEGAQPGQPGATAPATNGQAAPAPTASPSFGPKHNNGVVRIELSATCVRPGDLLVITFRAPPKAGLGMVIGYSDNQAHGAMLTGESDANGVYVWRVPVDPTVPDGDARVLVTATGPNWSQEGGGSADASFRVSRAGC